MTSHPGNCTPVFPHILHTFYPSSSSELFPAARLLTTAAAAWEGGYSSTWMSFHIFRLRDIRELNWWNSLRRVRAAVGLLGPRNSELILRMISRLHKQPPATCHHSGHIAPAAQIEHCWSPSVHIFVRNTFDALNLIKSGRGTPVRSSITSNKVTDTTW